jgi:hypothetical protein
LCVGDAEDQIRIKRRPMMGRTSFAVALVGGFVALRYL